MRRRIWTAAAGLASIAVLMAVPSAFAAYTTPKLEVRQAGAATTFKTTQLSSEDATAVLRIYVPAQATTTQAPGTTLGTATALLKLHALAGAEVPVTGNVVVAPPGAVPAATQAACLQGATPLATWVLAISIAGTPVNVPLWLVATTGAQTALGPAYLQLCLASPYIPQASGGAAAGAQLVNAEFTAQGVFAATSGTFVAIWTPWTVGAGTINATATVATPATIAGGAVSIAARTLRGGATVTGRVTQGGQPRAGATVNVFGGPRSNRLKRLGRVRTNASGNYTFRARTGVFFRANVTAAAGPAPAVCSAISAAIAPVPCVNPTINGFTAQSRVIRKR